MAPFPTLHAVFMVAMVATVRCQDNCYLGDQPTIQNARDYISCLRHQLYVMENDIDTGERTILDGAGDMSDDYMLYVDSMNHEASPLVPADEYDQSQADKRTMLEGDPDKTSGDHQLVDSYENTDQFPDCQGLQPEQCASLLAFLDQMARSLTSTENYYSVLAEDLEGLRERRSSQFNAVNADKTAHHLEKKKRKQWNAQRIEQMKALIKWHIQNGGSLKNAPKFKSRWGRSVDHVTISPSLQDSQEVRTGNDATAKSPMPMREKRSAIRAFLKGNMKSMSPKVRQMLAEYLAWKSKQTGYVKFTARHG